MLSEKADRTKSPLSARYSFTMAQGLSSVQLTRINFQSINSVIKGIRRLLKKATSDPYKDWCQLLSYQYEMTGYRFGMPSLLALTYTIELTFLPFEMREVGTDWAAL